MRFVVLIILAVAISGCAVNSYCLEEQDYQKGQTVPPLKGVEGLKLPESQTALRIPPPPAQSVPYGQKVKDAEGDEKVNCLDLPPRMPPPVEPRTAPAPAPAT